MSPGLIPHHEDGVYGAGAPAVNPRIPAGGLAVLLLVAAGCAAPSSTRPPYPVGISYAVELAAALTDGDPQPRMEEDFRYLRRLGFDTVFVRHAEDQDRRRIIEAARRCELAVAMPRREAIHYVRTGRLPPGCGSVEALVASGPRSEGGAAVLSFLGEVVDETTASRVGRLASAHRARATGVPTFALVAQPGLAVAPLRSEVTLLGSTPEAAGSQGVGGVLLLECVERIHRTSPAWSGGWLAKYHAGLAAGLTGGLMIDRFRALPGQWRALVEGDRPAEVRRSAAIRRITSRAARWGPKLRRLAPRDIEPVEPAGEDLRVVLFAGSKRRFVLVFNSSPNDFVHRPVSLPPLLAAKTVRRAVFVPSEGSAKARAVIRPGPDRLTLPLDLAPGDACLWEVF